MKTTTRRIAVLAMLALLLTLPFPVAASGQEGDAAKIGDTVYQSLPDAVAALQAGDTLELLRDVNVGTAQLSFKQSVTVKGNGFTITSENTDYAIVLENDIGTVVMENLKLADAVGGGFKMRRGVSLTLREVSVSSQNVAVLFTNASADSSLRIEGGSYVCEKNLIQAGDDLTGRSIRIDGGSYSTSGGTLLYAQNADVTINGGVFRNTGSSHSVTARGSTVLRVTGGAVINENAESTAAVFNLADSSVAQIYDGYFYNGGKGRALTTEGTSAAAMQEIALYGGSFVVTATGTCVRSDDSLRPLAIYGGSYFNYGGDWATAGSCTLHGGYLFAVKALNSSGSVTSDNAARNADGSLMMMDGLYCRLADGVPDTKTGASARLVEGSNGIRFESVIPKAALDYAESLKDAGTEITYGTVICPTDYLSDVRGMSMAAIEASGGTYENIPGVEGVSTDEEGNVTLRAALVNLQTENIGRDFSAVSYLSYVRDGATVYLYGLYLEADHSRSMAQVAESALADVKAQADAVYQYEYNGAFSPYTEAQRAVLEGYLDAVAE